MNSALPLADIIVPVGYLKSDTHATGAHESTGIDLSLFGRAMIAVTVGTVTDAGTIQLEQATKESFSDAKDLRTAVDLVTDKPAQIGVKADELDVNNGYRYVRAKLTATGGSVKAGIVISGLNARHSPAEALADSVIDE